MSKFLRLLFVLLMLTVAPDETREALLRLDVRRLDIWLSVAVTGFGFFVLIPWTAARLDSALGVGVGGTTPGSSPSAPPTAA